MHELELTEYLASVDAETLGETLDVFHGAVDDAEYRAIVEQSDVALQGLEIAMGMYCAAKAEMFVRELAVLDFGAASVIDQAEEIRDEGTFWEIVRNIEQDV